jgi:hypothetical protein
MKLITHVEVILSLSLFLATFSIFFLFFISSQYSQAILIRENKKIMKSIAISQILIYSNHSYSLSNFNYTILNFSKVSNFFNFCRNNEQKIKNDFEVNEFLILLNCPNIQYSCSTKNVKTQIRRYVVLNNNLCYLEIGVE